MDTNINNNNLEEKEENAVQEEEKEELNHKALGYVVGPSDFTPTK